jgi:hypothetical protein
MSKGIKRRHYVNRRFHATVAGAGCLAHLVGGVRIKGQELAQHVLE